MREGVKGRIAAFKKVTGPEIHEMDRSIFRPRKYFKVFRKKRKPPKRRKAEEKQKEKADGQKDEDQKEGGN